MSSLLWLLPMSIRVFITLVIAHVYTCLHYSGYCPCLYVSSLLWLLPMSRCHTTYWPNIALQDSLSRIRWYLCWFQNVFHFWECGFGNSNSFLDLIYTSSIITHSKLKRHDDSTHPCLTPLLIRISSERLFSSRIDALCVQYKFTINLRSFPFIPI